MTADRNAQKIETELRDIAHRVRRLTISRRDPDKFFEDRDEIGSDLEVIADRIFRERA